MYIRGCVFIHLETYSRSIFREYIEGEQFRFENNATYIYILFVGVEKLCLMGFAPS